MPDNDTTPAPDLGAFAAAIRGVLNTRPGAPFRPDAPEAIESWDRLGGYCWQWWPDGHAWRLTAGAANDPRPLVYGPDGYMRVDAVPGEHAAGLVLGLLRAGGAIPAAAPVDQARRYMPCCFADPATVLLADGRRLTCDACGTRYAPPAVGPERLPSQAELLAAATPPHLAASAARVTLRPRAPMVRGELFAVPSPAAEPLRAVFYRPSDPEPEVPFGYLTVKAASDRPDEQGRWEITKPDGYRTLYDPARACLMPYETPEGGTAFLRFEADQLPGHMHPGPRAEVATPGERGAA